MLNCGFSSMRRIIGKAKYIRSVISSALVALCTTWGGGILMTFFFGVVSFIVLSIKKF